MIQWIFFNLNIEICNMNTKIGHLDWIERRAINNLNCTGWKNIVLLRLFFIIQLRWKVKIPKVRAQAWATNLHSFKIVTLYVTSNIGKKSKKRVKTYNNLQQIQCLNSISSWGWYILHHCPLYAPLPTVTTRDWAVSVGKNPPIHKRKYRPN